MGCFYFKTISIAIPELIPSWHRDVKVIPRATYVDGCCCHKGRHMTRTDIMVVKLLCLLVVFGQIVKVKAVPAEYFNVPWVRENKNTFSPDWSYIPSIKKTRKIFTEAHIEIPQTAQEHLSDCSLSFTKDDAKITLYANGVMKTEKSEHNIEFFDVTSTLKCSLSQDGKLTSAHVDKKLQHACAVAVEDGFVVCKSIQKTSGSQQRLNCQIRMQDGFSTTFMYEEDGSIVAKESTAIVEVLPPFNVSVESIMKSHGMIELPKKALCTQAGVLCQDTNGFTCYALDGIFMRVTSRGTFNINVPTQAAVLEGSLVEGDIHASWKKTAPAETKLTSARLGDVDILFNNTSGEACLSVNPTTFEIGQFAYDAHGHYCRRNGTGCLRYGLVSPLLTYNGVCEVLSKSS